MKIFIKKHLLIIIIIHYIILILFQLKNMKKYLNGLYNYTIKFILGVLKPQTDAIMVTLEYMKELWLIV
jgi:hypothetical protein